MIKVTPHNQLVNLLILSFIIFSKFDESLLLKSELNYIACGTFMIDGYTERVMPVKRQSHAL